METIRDMDVVRATAARADVATTDTDGVGVMDVRFSVFGAWYEIDSWFEGQFMERVAKGAFTKTMRESRGSIKVLYDHGMDPSVGNKILGSIADLREEPAAALGVVDLFDTSYVRDLLPGLRAGAYGSSFKFRVLRDEWADEPGRSEHNPDGIPERTIKEVRLYEFGPVTFPASPSATAGVRGLTDSYYEQVRTRTPRVYDDLQARVRAIRTPAEAGAASSLTSASAVEGHPQGMSPKQRRHSLYAFLRE